MPSTPALGCSRAGALAIVTIVLSVGCGSAPVRPDGGTGLLPVGKPAPDLVGYDVDEKPTQLSTLKGRRAVVYFYPKDGTPGCTKEACAFRDAWARYERAGIVVFGVSDDGREKHAAFQREHELPFPLVADQTGIIGKAYGVHRGIIGYERVTFVVGKDGNVERVYPNVDPGVHAGEILQAAGEEGGGI